MQQSTTWTRVQGVPALQSTERWLLSGLLLLTLLSRLFLSGEGTLQGDMRYWLLWSDQLSRGGLQSFYVKIPNADYLPVYPYVLWLLGKIFDPLHGLLGIVNVNLTRDTVFKLPAILADVATVALLYVVGRRWTSPAAAGLAATAYAVNPAIIADSSRWGQVDSIPAFLMLLALVLLVDERMALCGAVLTLSVLTKPTALVLLPLVAVVALRRRRYAGLATCAASSLVVAALIVWPFIPPRMNVVEFVQQRFEVTTSLRPFATLKAFNLWALQQWNVLPLPDSRTWLGMSEHLLGWLLLLLLTLAICGVVAFRLPDAAEDRARLIVPAATVLILGFFILLTRIHERHLLPTLPLLALTCAMWARYWPFYVWLSAAYLLNLHYSAPGIFALHEPLLGPLEVPLISAVNVGVLVGMLALTASTISHKNAADSEPIGLLPWS
jgi:Gpi18-like mannosyltransferase